MKRIRLTISAAVLALAVFIASPVTAVGVGNSHAQSVPPAAGSGRTNAASTGNASQAANGSTRAAEARENAQNRSSEAKAKACQNRANAVKNIMLRISDRGQKQLDLFTTIADRVETFYTSKGYTLSNYDSLVADVDAQHTAAQNAVNAVASSSTGFSCDSNDPKAFVNSFQGSLKTEISALQTYRTSVKNLIVGVKSAQSQQAGTTTDTTTNTNQTNTGGNQ